MIQDNKWSSSIAWCEAHNYKWAIVNNHFYWQTNYQTAEIEPNGKLWWHDREYFDEITNS